MRSGGGEDWAWPPRVPVRVRPRRFPSWPGRGPSGPAPPKARDSFMAVSSTSGSRARGRGGRMRIVGAPTDSTATTWPEASRTGAATRGGAGDDFVGGQQVAASADALQVGSEPRRVGPRGGGEARQSLGEHLGLHRLRRMREQQAAGARVQRLALADRAVDAEPWVGLEDCNRLALQAVADAEVDILPQAFPRAARNGMAVAARAPCSTAARPRTPQRAPRRHMPRASSWMAKPRASRVRSRRKPAVRVQRGDLASAASGAGPMRDSASNRSRARPTAAML